jgi:hypothetical protein
VTGERECWCHKFGSLEEAFAALETYRVELRGTVALTIRAPGWTTKEIHAARIQWAMDRARSAGKAIGRPAKALSPGRASGILAGAIAVHGRVAGLRHAAEQLGVSVSTLRRAEREWVSKGVGSKGSR